MKGEKSREGKMTEKRGAGIAFPMLSPVSIAFTKVSQANQGKFLGKETSPANEN